MKVKEYLELIGKDKNSATTLTFVMAKAIKDENAPSYDLYYRNTPIRSIWEWQNSKVMDYYVLNENHPPIDYTGAWHNWYNNGKGHLMCMVVISKEDLELIYGEKQAAEHIAYREEVIRKRVEQR